MQIFLLVLALVFSAGHAWANSHGHAHGHSHNHGSTNRLPYSDLLQASEILSRSYTGNQDSLAALEVSRDLINRQVRGTLLDRSNSRFTAIGFVCPRNATGAVAACTEVRPARRVISQKIAQFRAAMIAIAEELREAGGDVNAVQTLKAYSLRRGGHEVIWVRTTLQDAANGNATSYANFSCHEVSHGNHNGMHCHFINGDANGPEEPQVNP